MNCIVLKELLAAFVEKDCPENEYPIELDELLSDTVKTGVVRFSWTLLKPLLKFRLESILNSGLLDRCSSDDEELSKELLLRLDAFDNPPFTIQRVCELVVYPKQHYKSRDKYMRAMEKNLTVVSTQAPDLTWMKSPRLTQLLEEPTTESLKRPDHKTPTFNENGDSVEHPTQSHSVAPPKKGKMNYVGSSSGGGTDVSMETSLHLKVEHPSPLNLPRKRNSSMRDSLEGGVGWGSEQEMMGLVLQEADSTTIEHLSHTLDTRVCPEQEGFVSTKDSYGGREERLLKKAVEEIKETECVDTLKQSEKFPGKDKSTAKQCFDPKQGGEVLEGGATGEEGGITMSSGVRTAPLSTAVMKLASSDVKRASSGMEVVSSGDKETESSDMEVVSSGVSAGGGKMAGANLAGDGMEVVVSSGVLAEGSDGAQKVETYKEAATGQMELGTQGYQKS